MAELHRTRGGPGLCVGFHDSHVVGPSAWGTFGRSMRASSALHCSHFRDRAQTPPGRRREVEAGLGRCSRRSLRGRNWMARRLPSACPSRGGLTRRRPSDTPAPCPPSGNDRSVRQIRAPITRNNPGNPSSDNPVNNIAFPLQRMLNGCEPLRSRLRGPRPGSRQIWFCRAAGAAWTRCSRGTRHASVSPAVLLAIRSGSAERAGNRARLVHAADFLVIGAVVGAMDVFAVESPSL